MRSIATAAKEAIDGADESLWQKCCELSGETPKGNTVGKLQPHIEEIIRSMSPEEHKLYGIEEGIK